MADELISEKINFYKPEKRFVIPIKSFHIPKKLFIDFKKTNFKFKINYNFNQVIENCAELNHKRNDTWINSIIY